MMTQQNGKKNVYAFYKDGIKIVLAAMKDEDFHKSKTDDGQPSLSLREFLTKSEANGVAYALFTKEERMSSNLPLLNIPFKIACQLTS